DFLKRNVMQYNYSELTVNFVGSIGWHYNVLLREIAENMGLKVGKIEKSPINGLIEFHSKLI
ncbi:MAG TPA: hypothetical protein VKX35_04345, partial [Fermentimonas sp.]|nr:hypothetical protein [Fermentimonas sp.]